MYIRIGDGARSSRLFSFLVSIKRRLFGNSLPSSVPNRQREKRVQSIPELGRDCHSHVRARFT